MYKTSHKVALTSANKKKRKKKPVPQFPIPSSQKPKKHPIITKPIKIQLAAKMSAQTRIKITIEITINLISSN